MNPVLRVVGLAALIVLVGCSPPPEPDDHVATLATTRSGPATVNPSSATPPASRPRERLDMTPDEVNELIAVYSQCLADHGLPKGRPAGKTSTADEAAAETACLGVKPLPPWEYDTTNPESADFVHALVQCLRDKGVRYVDEEPAVPGDDRRTISLGGPDNDPESISKGLDLIPACEKERAHS